MIKVKTAHALNRMECAKYGNLYGVMREFNLYGTMSVDGVDYRYNFYIHPGFLWDGASNLKFKLLQKVFPGFVDDDPVFNAASALHDWLYARTGELCEGFNLTRDECDDMLRGIARESRTMQSRSRKVARFCCSCADFFVGLFAGGDSHWGNDEYRIRDKAEFRLVSVR